MTSKTFLLQALAALGAASPFANPNPNWGYPPSGCKNPEPICQKIQSYLPYFPSQSASVTASCSKVLGIKTTTITATSTSTVLSTNTIKAVTTTTVTSTPTSYTSTQTCFQNTATAKPAQKRSPTWNNNGWGSGSSNNEKISSACSCFGVNLSPKTTSTSVKTVTSVGGSTTVYSSTATSVVTAATVTTVLTNYVPSTGEYTADDGTKFAEYEGYDFYGYDLEQGTCSPDNSGNPGIIDTRWHGSYACSDFDDCQNTCSQYNARLLTEGPKDPNDVPCTGVTYHIPKQNSRGYCYLKYGVPGNGAPNCSPRINSDDESSILVKNT